MKAPQTPENCSSFVLLLEIRMHSQKQLHHADPGGYSMTFNMGGVHANIWGPKFYVKSIFGVCEVQHGQQFNILGPQI